MTDPGVPLAITRQAVTYRAAIAQALHELGDNCTGCLKARATLQQAVNDMGDYTLLLRATGLLGAGQQNRDPHVPWAVPEQRDPHELTVAQAAVLKQVAQGMTLHEIARANHVDVSAVGRLLRRVENRLGVKGRPALVKEARRLGLI